VLFVNLHLKGMLHLLLSICETQAF